MMVCILSLNAKFFALQVSVGTLVIYFLKPECSHIMITSVFLILFFLNQIMINSFCIVIHGQITEWEQRLQQVSHSLIPHVFSCRCDNSTCEVAIIVHASQQS